MTEWDKWRDVYAAWSSTDVHRRRVDRAVSIAMEAHRLGLRSTVGWSAGKDSTALVALLVEAGIGAPAFSVKDDLDFPGEEEYVAGLAARLGVSLTIVRPDTSLFDWLRAWSSGGGDVTDDIHGHSSPMAREHFYRLVDRHREIDGYDLVYLGLRQEESWGRRMATARGGPIRTRRDGLTVACPLSYWSSRDVFAYLVQRGIEPHECYTRILPGEDPGTIRKSWWLPGKSSRYGGLIRLRRLWPDLWSRAAEAFTEIGAFS